MRTAVRWSTRKRARVSVTRRGRVPGRLSDARNDLQARRDGGAGRSADGKEDAGRRCRAMVRRRVPLLKLNRDGLDRVGAVRRHGVLPRRIDRVDALQTHARARAVVDAQLVDEVAWAVGPGHGRGRAHRTDLRKRALRRRRRSCARRRRDAEDRRNRGRRDGRRCDRMPLRAAAPQARLDVTRGHEVPLKRFMLEIVVAPTARHQNPKGYESTPNRNITCRQTPCPAIQSTEPTQEP